MFDGRESFFSPLNNEQTFQANLNADLTQQAIDATLIHAQGAQTPTPAQLADIVSLETALNSAQIDFYAGNLYGQQGSYGGPQYLPSQRYYPGINDSLGGDPQGKQFDPNVFTIYSSWQNSRNRQQASIARGEQIFNTQPLTISNVPGLVSDSQDITGTCLPRYAKNTWAITYSRYRWISVNAHLLAQRNRCQHYRRVRKVPCSSWYAIQAILRDRRSIATYLWRAPGQCGDIGVAKA